MTNKFPFLILFFALTILFSCSLEEDKEKNNLNANIEREIIQLSYIEEEFPEMISDELINNCKQAIDLSRTTHNKDLELQCLIQLFKFQNAKELYKEALNTGNIALELANDLKDKKALAQIYKLLGWNYYHLSSYHTSFQSYETSLTLFTHLNDTLNTIDVLNMQGNIYFIWKDYHQAFSYYERCFDLGKLINKNRLIAKALTNMGIVYASRSEAPNLDKDSLEYFQNNAIHKVKSALVFVEKSGHQMMKAEILNNLAQIYQFNGDVKNSLQCIQQARKISENISTRIYINSTLTNASILLGLDSLGKAKQLLFDVIDLAKQKNLSSQYSSINMVLSEIYEKEANYLKAFETQKIYASLSDSIFNLDYKRKIDAIKLASEMEKIKEEEKLKRQKVFYRTLVLVLVLISLIIIIGFLYSRTRARNVNFKLQNKLLTERLETRNKELTNRIMALIQRNELEKEIVQKLNSLQPKMKKENQNDIKDIINDLSFKQNDQLWKEFEVRFENVHQEFYSKLSELYPDLTTNEKRLCAFLYLDMSSKDISAITGQSTRALNVARTRLRKKFDLTNSQQSLSSHLNTI